MDWGKLSKRKQLSKPTDPLIIYEESDRESTTGPLRESQKKVLSEWYEKRFHVEDIIIKMHTGEGKTLVGLLILQSRLNSDKSPCVYVCPNTHLVNQVCNDAKKFGIDVCTAGSGELPDDFISGKKILVVNTHKMFNGLSKFGITANKYEDVNTVLLDDSHACIEVIRSASTIRLKNNDSTSGIVYNMLIDLFRNDLISQGEGTFLDTMDGNESTLMVVPYWNWIDKKSDVLNILMKHNNDESIKFAWPLVRDSIEDCICCVTRSYIEISPYNPNVSSFPSFCNAKQRILMSATTQDDSYSIKCLNFNLESVRDPLTNETKKWYGEKMIVIPSLVSQEYDENLVRAFVKNLRNCDFGTLVIVPSDNRSFLYNKNDVATKGDIFDRVSDIKSRQNGFLVVVNRYDGIDLPDDSCRVLLMDSKPYFNKLSDRYEEKCRPDSKIINKKLSQKIEQGLGRGVRGEKDYCVVILIGPKLVKFIRNSDTKTLFSNQTRKQIEIGVEITEEIRQDKHQNFDAIVRIINDCLQRDEGWKQYYKERMNTVDGTGTSSDLCDVFEKEREIYALYSREPHKAIDELQNFINSYDNEIEKGWYLQELARYYYTLGSKKKATDIQKSALKLNENLLKPDSVEYKTMGKFHEKRNQKIIDYVNSHSKIEDFKLSMDDILDDLSFSSDADNFEKSLYEVGKFLGFNSERPEKHYGRGPDNLWQVSSNKFFLFECKNGVKLERQWIHKSETEQITHSFTWFENNYPDQDVECYLIHPTSHLDSDAVLNKKTRIISPSKLQKLNSNIKTFVKELCTYKPDELTTDIIQKILDVNDLDYESFNEKYSINPKAFDSI